MADFTPSFMGMDRGPALVDLPYSHHDVSSVLYGHDVGTGLGRGRMDAVVGWNADIIDKSPWIRLDLETVEKVLGISTAGRGDQMEWVAQYRVQYSINGETWADARPLNAPTNTIFEGNVDFISRKDNMFADGGVQARFIRVQPVHWVGPTAAMRVGLIMESPYSLKMRVTITPLSRLVGNAMPPLEKEVPAPKQVLFANWEGYDGEYEDMDNEATICLVPAVPPLAKLKQMRQGARAASWTWAPIKGLARRDGLVLQHWVRTADKDADYQFSQLNVAVADLPTYTDDEYAKLIAPLSGDWSRADTDHLMELARQFDRRFIVIHDRYSPPSHIERSMEDLKDRFYRISTILRAHRNGLDIEEELDNSMPFDAAHERLRKKQLSLLLARTAEEVEEDEFVGAEMKKINQRNKREHREVREREPSVEAVSLTPQKSRKKSRKESMTSNAESVEDMPLPLKKMKRPSLTKDEPRPPQSPAAEPVYTTPSAVPLASASQAGRKASSGVTLNSARLLQPYQQMSAKLSKKIVGIYEQYGLVVERLMPSSRVLTAAEDLRIDVTDLIELQKQVDRLEGEAKALRARLSASKAPAQPQAAATPAQQTPAPSQAEGADKPT